MKKIFLNFCFFTDNIANMAVHYTLCAYFISLDNAESIIILLNFYVHNKVNSLTAILLNSSTVNNQSVLNSTCAFLTLHTF
jgi:hypothetical protein